MGLGGTVVDAKGLVFVMIAQARRGVVHGR